jgi:hypothetical protein
MVPSSSFANTEIRNTNCKTINKVKIVNGNQYVCIKKKNNKNVWHKKNKINEVKTEAFVPWSTKFKIDVMFQQAINSTNKYSEKTMPSSSYEFAIENSVKESDRKWITQMLDYTNGFFSKVEREKPTIFLGNSHQWSRDTMKNAGVWIGHPNQPYPCSNGTQDAYCAGYKNIVLLIFMNPSQNWDIGRLSTPAHEIFHTVQHSLLDYDTGRMPPGHPRAVPRWLKEGSANYFGYYVVQKLGFDSYENGRNSQIRFNSEYRNVKPLSTYDNFESNPYGIGQAATEYIIASVGFESLLNIFKFTGTEGSFSAGFKKATGIELSEFYSKFEDARSSMQIGS